MRAVIQRVTNAKVECKNTISGEINKGILVLLGVEDGDNLNDVKYIADKITGLRIFEDENEKMNLSIKDVNGELLVVSQFTLLGDCKKGNRPNFMAAAKSEIAKELYEKFTEYCRSLGFNVQTGVFKEYMLVKINNDGPVTLIIDSRR